MYYLCVRVAGEDRERSSSVGDLAEDGIGLRWLCDIVEERSLFQRRSHVFISCYVERSSHLVRYNQ